MCVLRINMGLFIKVLKKAKPAFEENRNCWVYRFLGLKM